MKRQRKTKPINLGSITCFQLYEWAKQPAPENECTKNLRIRYYLELGNRMDLLRMCHNLSARNFKQHILVAIKLCHVPHVKMVIGGGQPKKQDMPIFSAALKYMAAMNGIVLHRWGRGAYILDHPNKAPSARMDLV